MFTEPMQRFSKSLQILRSYVISIEPILMDRRSRVLKEHALTLSVFALLIHESDPEGFPLGEAEKKRIQDYWGEAFKMEASEKEEGETKIKFSIVDIKMGKKLKSATQELWKVLEQIELLYGSSLINLVSFFEVFVSQLVRQHLLRHPGQLNDKPLTFAELKQINSVDDAKDYLVDREVEGILKGSFNKWIDFLKGRVELSMSYLDEHRDFIVEVFQRRNILVHNDGIVNSIYLSNVTPEYQKGIKLGDNIGVTREYLERVVDIIERAGLLIGAELWKKLEAEDKERARVLNRLAYEHLLNEKWGIAESLSYFAMNDKKMPEEDQLIAKVNYWQSLKWSGRFDEVEEEVSSADFSAKARKFQLALHALMDRNKVFFELLPKCVPDEIPIDDAKEWPIFREMRKCEEFSDFLAKF